MIVLAYLTRSDLAGCVRFIPTTHFASGPKHTGMHSDSMRIIQPWGRQCPSQRAEPRPRPSLHIESEWRLLHLTPGRRRTFVEFLQERPLGPTLWLEEDAQDVINLLPAIHRLLVLLPATQRQVVDYANVGDMTIFLESSPYTLAEIWYCDIQRIDRNDFWCL